MASSYSTNLAIELIGTGDQAGTWGTTTNTNLGTLIEQAISGYVTQAVSTGGDTTITIPNGATGVARNMYIELTGTGGASTNLIVPSNKKLYFVFNNTASGQVTVKVAGQTGVSVPNGAKMILVSNGTDIVDATNYVGNISAASGNITTLTSASATITNLIATTGSVSDLSATVSRAGSATITNLTATSASVTNLTATSATISNFTFTSATVTRIAATSATVSDLSATVSRMGSATVTNLLATSLTVSSGSTLNGGVVVNETGADVDFRIESDTNANAFFLDGANGNVGIGTNSPSSGVSSNSIGLHVQHDNVPYLALEHTGVSGKKYNIYSGSTGSLTFYDVTSGSARMVIDTSGNLGIGTTSPGALLDVRGSAIFNEAGADADFRIEGDTDANLFFVDASQEGVGVGVPTTVRGKLNVSASTSLSLESQTYTGDALLISAANISPAINTYGSGITWSRLAQNGYRRAAITSVQTTSDEDQVGLAFFTHPSTGLTVDIAESMRLDHNGNLLFNQAASFIGTNTADGADSSVLTIGGGGAASSARGAYLNLIGNEHPSTGNAELSSGNVSGSYVNIVGRASNSDIRFATGGTTERMRITSDGELLVGGTTAIGAAQGTMTIERLNGNPLLSLFRNDTSVASADIIGALSFAGNDTTSNTPKSLAAIYARASGTHAAGDNPTDLVFYTTPDGTEGIAEAARITQAGGLVVTPIAGGTSVFNEDGADADFRIESDTNTHALFVDGGTSFVGIGVSDPSAVLDIANGPQRSRAVDSGRNSYRITKSITASTAATVLLITVPVASVAIFIKMMFVNSRATTSNSGTAKVGERYFSIVRNSSGSDVVLNSNLGSKDWTDDTTTAGGAINAISAATTIARNAAEANTDPQVVKITFNPSTTGGSSGSVVMTFEILALSNPEITIV